MKSTMQINYWTIGGFGDDKPVAQALREAKEMGYEGVELCFESGAFGPRDVAIAQLLSRQLENLLRLNARHVPAPRLRVRLSRRQAEVADLVAQGLTNREIARKLFVGIDTVKKHVTKVLEETGCANRTRLALEWQGVRADEHQAW